MNPEQITQAIEAVKTLNLNIDSQSSIEITKIIKPILWFGLVRDFVGMFLNTTVAIVFFLLLYKLIIFLVKLSRER